MRGGEGDKTQKHPEQNGAQIFEIVLWPSGQTKMANASTRLAGFLSLGPILVGSVEVCTGSLNQGSIS